MSYRHSTLTRAIADTHSPLRRYFDHRFPHLRATQAAYRAAAGPLSVPATAAAPGTIGAAFDYLIRFTLDPTYLPQPALAPTPIRSRPDNLHTVTELAQLAGHIHTRPGSQDTFATAARASWALALCTELYRNPLVLPNSALAQPLRTGTFTVEVLLGLAPAAAVGELEALYALAVTELADILSPPPERVVLGPVFTASRYCAADADLIVDGTLIELKTRLGTANRTTGQRSDSLSLPDLYQLLGYLLFDTTDTYSLHTVALYSARYGHLHRWPAQQLLDDLAGNTIDLATEHATVWDLLTTGHRQHETGATLER